jgi:hypothetical protein
VTGPRVFTIPPHRAFADALAAGLIARYGGDKTGLAQGLILVPNNRAGRAITDAFVRRSLGPRESDTFARRRAFAARAWCRSAIPSSTRRIGGALEALERRIRFRRRSTRPSG